jgi:fatty-acyl-CoA synthase
LDLTHLIRRAVLQFPSAPGLSSATAGIRTTGEAVDRAERLANALDGLGLPPGCPVGVLSENRIEYPEIDLGLALGRRVRVALNSRLSRDDFRFALADCGARAIIHSAAFAEDAAALCEELDLVGINVDDPCYGEHSYVKLIADASSAPVLRPGLAEDPAWISYTSGTTGRAKGVILSHRAIAQVALNILLELGPLEPGERLLLAQPLSHGAGYFVLPQLISGGGLHIQERFDPEEIVALQDQRGMTTLKLVPAMFPPLLEAYGSRARFGYRTVVYGAAPMPAPLLEEASAAFGDVLVQIYGQSEAPVTLTCLHKQDHARPGDHRRSAGRPWRSVEVVVRNPDGEPLATGEIGEVTVRGPHHMTGYLNLPDATAEAMRNGWIWTKDMGQLDEEGYVHLLGRRDEMINSGGFNISPREVERVLADHPAVEECVVLGLPDIRWGAAVSALVHLRAGREVSVEALLDFARPRLTFRTPKTVLIGDAIPKNAYGKVDRTRVIAAFMTSEGNDNADGS